MADIGYWIPFFKRAYFEQDVLDVDWSHLWSPFSFQFEHGKTPFTHIGAVFATLLGYILLSFALQAWMKNRAPFKLTGFVVFHNALLCLWSLAMAIGIGYGAYEAYRYYGNSFLSTLSDEKRFISSTPSLGLSYWTYIFYLSKFYEMIDTYIMALKKRPLTFLQMYHHSVIVLVVWSWMEGVTPGMWYCVFANTLVHVVMYYYFAIAALGQKPWWKKYLTTLQLVQFASYFGCMNYWVYMNTSYDGFSDTFPFIKFHSTGFCNGTWFPFIFSIFVNLSMIALFMQFYLANYPGEEGKGSKAGDQKEGKAKAEGKKQD